MRREPKWLDQRALTLLHSESLATFGGASGMRDPGLLEAALARPRNHYLYNKDCTLADLAAAYGFALATCHAFVDGNKRAAFLAIGLFLSVNGKELHASQVEAIEAMLALADGSLDESGLAAWITKHARTRPRV